MIRRILLHAVLLAYLAVTAVALVRTMTGRWLPGIPPAIAYYAFGMMAPYQGYATRNEELVAEGLLPDGSWQTIDLKPYLPFGFGERNVRGYKMTVRRIYGPEALPAYYTSLARQLLERERVHGNAFTRVQLHWDIWPVSPEGFYNLKIPAFTDSTVLATTP